MAWISTSTATAPLFNIKSGAKQIPNLARHGRSASCDRSGATEKAGGVAGAMIISPSLSVLMPAIARPGAARLMHGNGESGGKDSIASKTCPNLGDENAGGLNVNARSLRSKIAQLREDTPLHKKLERTIKVGTGHNGAWYASQKEHWLGWLREYDGPGAYGRSTHSGRDARYIYNHIQCAPMLFWLAEAVEVPEAQLDAAFAAVVKVKPRGASQCGALRKAISWDEIEARIDGEPKVGSRSIFSRRS